MRIKVPTLTCKRCKHTWVPRTTEVLMCPKCKSPFWNRERRVKKKGIA